MTTSDDGSVELRSRADNPEPDPRHPEPGDLAIGLIDWSAFGHVLPILAASPAGDPVRSGLARASRSDGPRREGPASMVGSRFSWRARALLARLDYLPQTAVEPADQPPSPKRPSRAPKPSAKVREAMQSLDEAVGITRRDTTNATRTTVSSGARMPGCRDEADS